MTTSLLKKVFIISLLVLLSWQIAPAQFATTGTGRYKEQIFWLNWDKSTGTTGLTTFPASFPTPMGRSDGATLVAGEYIWVLTPEKVRVVGTISNLSASPIGSANINLSPANGGTGNYSTGFP